MRLGFNFLSFHFHVISFLMSSYSWPFPDFNLMLTLSSFILRLSFGLLLLLLSVIISPYSLSVVCYDFSFYCKVSIFPHHSFPRYVTASVSFRPYVSLILVSSFYLFVCCGHSVHPNLSPLYNINFLTSCHVFLSLFVCNSYSSFCLFVFCDHSVDPNPFVKSTQLTFSLTSLGLFLSVCLCL